MSDGYDIDLDRYFITIDELDGAQESRCYNCNRLLRTDQLRYCPPYYLCTSCSKEPDDRTLPRRRRIAHE
jgi:hypothetical protein